MNDLGAYRSPPSDQAPRHEPNEEFWGAKVIGKARVVDAVPYVSAFIGAAPGLLLAKSGRLPVGATALAVVGGIVGFVAGSFAWLVLPPHCAGDIFTGSRDPRSVCR